MVENFDNNFYFKVSSFDTVTLDNDEPSNLNDRPNVQMNDIHSSRLEVVDDDEMNAIISDVIEYKPLSYHWFYTSYLADKLIWLPMSNKDSGSLEKAFLENEYDLAQ